MQNSSEYPDHLSVLSRALWYFFADNLSRVSSIRFESGKLYFYMIVCSVWYHANKAKTFPLTEPYIRIQTGRRLIRWLFTWRTVER